MKKLSFIVALMVALLELPLPIAVQADELTKPDEAAIQAAPSQPANRDAAVLQPPITVSEEAKETFSRKRPRVVLALGGGAFKAIAQIGVIRSLERHGIPIDGIVGTSFGSVIGSLYCAGRSTEEIEKLFIENRVQKAMLSGVVCRALLRPLSPLTSLVCKKSYPGASSGKAYGNLLREILPRSFKDLNKPFAAVVTNLTEGRTRVLSDGDLATAVQASSAVPLLLKPVMIDGSLYVDGGLRANLPSNIADALGADVTISVLVDKAIRPVSNERLKKPRALMLRVADIMMAAADHPKATSSDILIYPNVDFMPALTKDKSLIKKAIAAGEKAADAAIPEITNELVAAKQQQKKGSQL